MAVKKSNKTLVIILLTLLFASIVTAVYFLIQYNQTKTLLRQKQANPASVASQDKQKLLKDLGKLMQLPNEDPSIVATVTDKSKLKNAFFNNAAVGDRFIVFAKAQKAILYRPLTNKIIEVGPVSMTKETTTPAVSQQPEPTSNVVKVSVAIYNGTKTSGYAETASQKVTGSLQNLNIIYKGNAKGDYTQTEIIDMKGNNLETSKQLAQLLSGKIITSLPGGEDSKGADIVILLGK